MISQLQSVSKVSERRCEELENQVQQRDRQNSEMIASLEAMDLKAANLQAALDMEVAKTVTL